MTSMLKAQAPYCRCPTQISLTTNQNWSKMEQEIEKNRLVHEQAIAEISEATEQDTVCTVCNPPYWSICWTLYKRNVPVEILPCWNVKHVTLLELSFSDLIVNRKDRILVSAALHAKDPGTEIARMGKDSRFGVPEHLYDDQGWTSNWRVHWYVKSATLSRLRTNRPWSKVRSDIF